MGRRCTGRGCVICSPELKGDRQRKTWALREREQRHALSRVQAGAVYDIGEDFQAEAVTLTRGVW